MCTFESCHITQALLPEASVSSGSLCRPATMCGVSHAWAQIRREQINLPRGLKSLV